jgi:hypothetical protein
MAGTRLLLQSLVLIELLFLVVWSVHVGFCRPKLAEGPLLSWSSPSLETDVLCPWHHVGRWLWAGDEKRLDGSLLSQPQTLRWVWVLEDASVLSQWASVLQQHRDYLVPSFIEKLEDVQIITPLYVVPPLNVSVEHLTELDMQKIWKHFVSHTNWKVDDATADHPLCILYLSNALDQALDGTMDPLMDCDSANCTVTGDPTPPPVWSFRLEFDDTTTGPWMLIPSTTNNVNGSLGSLLEEWMFESIVNSCRHEDKEYAEYEETKVFQLCLCRKWQVQTLRIMEHALHHGIIQETIPLPTLEDIQTNGDDSLKDLQAAVGKWQQTYAKLQTMWLQQTGQQYIPTVPPTPLRQDFPVQHYAAIFMPLLFPLLVPFLISTIKEYKRWKEKKAARNKTGEMPKEKAE